MNIIPSQEIKRRGIGAVDNAIKKGPVHVIKNNQPSYVILTEVQYQELIDLENEAYINRVKASLADIKTGRVTRFKSVPALMKALEENEDEK